MNSQDLSERRRHPRIEAAATVLATASRGFIGSYLVRNLSLGGALISGGPGLACEKRVHLLLQLPGRAPIGLTVEIVRHDKTGAGEHLFGVAFHDLAPNELKAIQKIGLEILGKKGAPPLVLVACGSSDAQKAIKQELWSLGFGAVPAMTPIQMVSCLQEPNVWFEAAIVDECFGRQDGAGVLAFLANEYPEIFRVLVSAGDPPALPNGCANVVLTIPWKKGRLQEILVWRSVE